MRTRTVYSLFRKNKLTANVLTQWNRKKHIGCKFLPNDVVLVNPNKKVFTHESNRNTLAKYADVFGIVIAVTTLDGKTIRAHGARQYTKYYVLFFNGKVVGYHSHYLTLAL